MQNSEIFREFKHVFCWPSSTQNPALSFCSPTPPEGDGRDDPGGGCSGGVSVCRSRGACRSRNNLHRGFNPMPCS